jgi:PTS system nitrogen regulatory IIA component
MNEFHLPATSENGQYRFDRSEILEWATASKITLSSAIFGELEGPTVPTLVDALRTGGIQYDIQATDKSAALAEVVRRIHLPPDVDRQFLLSVLLAREAAASTGVGDGIAFPHVRNPIVLHVKQPMIALGFLTKPIDYGAMDGKPVYALFTFVCPTVRAHLHLLSRLAFALRHREFKSAIQKRVAADEILRLAQAVETRLSQKSGFRS